MGRSAVPVQMYLMKPGESKLTLGKLHQSTIAIDGALLRRPIPQREGDVSMWSVCRR